tara:strand:- start:357 stop:725 length:369 start_codon:yes stop_codon:yes gene_type:complete
MNNLKEAFKTTRNKGGFTFDLQRGEIKSGFVCAIDKETERYFYLSNKANFDANLKAFIFANSENLVNENFALGVWYYDETKKVYFDVVEIIHDKKEAIKKGFERQQLAIFNLDTFTEVKILI